MRWEDERYVRLYTRDTGTWKLLGWEGRFVLMSLLRKVDRAGILDVEGDGVEWVAAVTDTPEEIVRVGLERLIARGVVVRRDTTLCMPNFMAAQEAKQSDRARQRDKRERDRALALLDDVTHRDTESRTVTQSHAPLPSVTETSRVSHGVTRCHSVLNRAVLNPPLVPPSGGGAPPALDPPPVVTKEKRDRTRPRTSAPSSSATPEAIAEWLSQWAIPPKDPEVPKFLDHARANARLCADWSAAWRNWKAKAPQFAPGPSRFQPYQPEPRLPDKGPSDRELKRRELEAVPAPAEFLVALSKLGTR